MAEGFALPLQLLAFVIVMNGAEALRGNAGAVVIVPGNHVIQLRPVSVKAVLAHCLVLRSLKSNKFCSSQQGSECEAGQKVIQTPDIPRLSKRRTRPRELTSAIWLSRL
jgi:hypothetical protein